NAETERLRPFHDRLEKDAADAQANLEVGKSWCFVRDRWEKGLPYLAKSGDPLLRDLAQKDVAGPQKAPDQAALAEGGGDAARKERGEPRLQILRRSYQWYRQAAVQLEGAARARADQRLKELTVLLPARLRVTDVATELRRLRGHAGEVLGVALLPGGRQAV